ncbi:MAG: hypothetical protein MJZ61_00645 [Bacteroidales bacterium]|nr:hypothetical protein [Bacteroidales bacterium]
MVNYSEAQVVNYANDFLELGGFSASQALGNSDFSLICNSGAVFCNPAGLLSGDFSYDFQAMHNRYLDGLASHDMISAAHQVDTSLALGLGIMRVGIDNIQNTINLVDAGGGFNYDGITYFSAADWAMFLSMACRPKWLPGNIACGINTKLIYRMEGDFARAYGFGVDLSLSCRTARAVYSAILRDATTTFDFWSVDQSQFGPAYLATGNSVPQNRMELTAPSLILSSAWAWQMGAVGIDLSAAMRGYFAQNGHYLLHSNVISANPMTGVQLNYKGVVFLRGGVSDWQYDKNSTLSNHLTVRGAFGAGLQLLRFRLDYAYSATQSVGLGSNMITIGWSM